MGTLRMGVLTRRRVGLRAADLEYAVLDTETTGLDPRTGARIVEIAVVRVRGDGTLLEEFTTLVDPRADVTGREFHGIGEGDVIGAPTADEVVPEVVRLLSGAVVVGHNLDFEQRFLTSELVPFGLPESLPGLCTLRALRAQVDLERYSLPKASYALSGVWPTGQHTALGDARACARLLVEMIANAPGELRYRGAPPLPVAIPAPRRVPVAAGAPAEGVRWKPRTAAPPGDLLTPRPWADIRWRSLELDPLLCGGAFGATDRAIAEMAAHRDARTRRRVAAAVAVAGGLAAGGLLAGLRHRLRVRQ
ncbi:3'-5' exonuclease [Nocardiopsis sp. N85]|uniref:3'-5' exonuclease n=1 Tax=Nocardiopsis sp. N85 TaxID=3029400 RepID=UPI00237F82C8|nr:3'-5' exonuclease [Nocardiopsis sp. N85]MDE3719801.1 3'-5' exonuclease [Nocardiopsis sp. N85]